MRRIFGSVRFLALVPLVALAGCGVEEPGDPAGASAEDVLRADGPTVQATLVDQACVGARLAEMFQAVYTGHLPEEPVVHPTSVIVVLCIGEVCAVGTATTGPEPCELTVTLPVDPALVGLPVTATTSTGQTYSGTYP